MATLALALAQAAAVFSGCAPHRSRARPGASNPAALTIPIHGAVSPVEAEAYAGSAACAPCHAREAGQASTHHARTLAAVRPGEQAALFRDPSGLQDPERQIRYQATAKDGRCVLLATHGGYTEALPAEYAFGSGNRGVTYLGYTMDRPVELRLSYYRSVRRWEFTPGQQVGIPVASALMGGRVLDATEEEHCFLCHTTTLVKEEDRIRPGRSTAGVGCEACHGPGTAHIEAVRRADPDPHMPDLARVRNRVSTELCGQCHRSPVTGDPGNPFTASQLPRLQGLALSQSACFKKSGGQLSCITCHEPHCDADRTSHAEYNAVCGGCHSPSHPPQKPCKRQPQGDCVTCHMPAQPVPLPTNPTFRTHWIKVW